MSDNLKQANTLKLVFDVALLLLFLFAFIFDGKITRFQIISFVTFAAHYIAFCIDSAKLEILEQLKKGE